MAKEVFISHSSKDAEIANTICRTLEDRGLNCWIAPRDIGPGENFQESIVRAIRAAKVMVLIFSANANDSAEVKKELVLSSQHKLSVIPVRIEDVVPAEAFAYELSTRQWVDMFTTSANAVGNVGDRIKQMLTDGAGSPAIAPIALPLSKRATAAGSPAPWLIGVGVAALVLIAGGLYFVMRPSTAPPSPAPVATTVPPTSVATPPAPAPPAAPAPQATAPQTPPLSTVTASDIAQATKACPEAQPLTASDDDTKVKLASALIECSLAAQKNRELKVAARQARVALSIAEPLAASNPDSREFKALLGLSHARFGHVLQAVGDLPAATREYRADVALREGVLRQVPNGPALQMALSVSEMNLGKALQEQSDTSGARQAFSRCVELRRAATTTRPNNAEWQDMKTACETALSSLPATDQPR